jgi:hypothetical protein
LSLQVSKYEDLEFVTDATSGVTSVEWTVTCPKSLKGMKNSGGVDIKVTGLHLLFHLPHALLHTLHLSTLIF